MWMPPRNRLLLPHHWDERLVAAWSPGIQGAGGLVLRDQSGNGHHGTLVGGPAWKDQSLSSSNAGYVDCGNSGRLNNWVEQTITAWIKYDGLDDPYPRVIEKGLNNEWTLTFNTGQSSGNILTVQYGDATPNLFSTTNFNDGQWHHAAVTIDIDEFVSLYVDGELQDSLGMAAYSPAKTGVVYIGGNAGAGITTFNGLLDDIRLYCAALPHSEIAELWNGGERNAAYGIRRRRTVAPRAVTAAGLLPITQAYMRTRC